MKVVTGVIGIILIIIGIIMFAYRGYTYTTKEKVMQIGTVEISAEQPKTVYFPPLAAGLSLVVGIILVVVARKK